MENCTIKLTFIVLNITNINHFYLLSTLFYNFRNCCLCSILIDANSQGMCNACAKSQIDIAEGVTTTATIFYCKGCDRYQRPPWVRLQQESNDMMSFLLSKLKGMKYVKLIDSNFIWTEPHSKRKKIKLTVQKEFNNALLQTSFICEFTEEWTQCDDCKKTFTPHLWTASCQVRQKVYHKRTFLFLEQAVLKHNMHEKALNIKETPEGVDFYFKNRSHANAFSDFVHSILPAKVKDSKRLVSHDQWSNLYNYKYSYMIEVAPVCKDDLIILTKEQAKEFGGIGQVLLCYKTSTNVHLMDPLTFEVIVFDENTYWRHNFKSHIDRSAMEEFIIQNVEEEINYKEKYSANNLSVTVTDDINMNTSNQNASKSTDYKNTRKILVDQSTGLKKSYFSKREKHCYKICKVDCIKVDKTTDGEHKLFTFRTHLGEKLRPGDIAYGYDIGAINTSLFETDEELLKFPEIVLVKKKYVRNFKRLWKLERMTYDKKAKEEMMNVEEENQEEIGKNKKKKNKEKKVKEKEKEKNELKYKNKKDGKNLQNADDQYEDFLKDIEEDKELRNNINIYKEEDVLKELTEKFDTLQVKEILKKNNDDFGIDVSDLMAGLKISGDEVVSTKKDKEFLEPLPISKKGVKENAEEANKKKIKLANRGLGVNEEKEKPKGEDNGSKLKSKRTRTGSEIASSGNEDK